MNELETKLIATALTVEPNEREAVFRQLEPDFFSDSEAKGIVKALRDVYKSYPNADYTVFLQALDLETKQQIVSAINELVSPTIASEQLTDTVNAFREEYKNRELKRRATEMVLTGVSPDNIRKLAEWADELNAKEVEPSGKHYLRTYAEPVSFIPSGFPELDSLLNGGFLRGTLVTIGARPSTGKTTYAVNIATHSPRWKVLFISVEMSTRMIYDRIVADKADVDYNVSTLHQVEPEKVKMVIERLDNLTVIDNINEIEAIEELIYSAKPDIVILDYIQIVSSHKRFSDNRQRIDYISQKLKMAAKKTDCVVISLSQITRGGKDCPTMSDLKESGGLEQDSDYILLLYREYVNDKGNAGVEPEETIITLDKNKFGRTGEFDMKFIGNRQRFIESDAITRPVNTEDEDNDLPFDL